MKEEQRRLKMEQKRMMEELKRKEREIRENASQLQTANGEVEATAEWGTVLRPMSAVPIWAQSGESTRPRDMCTDVYLRFKVLSNVFDTWGNDGDVDNAWWSRRWGT